MLQWYCYANGRGDKHTQDNEDGRILCRDRQDRKSLGTGMSPRISTIIIIITRQLILTVSCPAAGRRFRPLQLFAQAYCHANPRQHTIQLFINLWVKQLPV